MNSVLIQPKLGEGIYLVKDISKILSLDYDKVYRWIEGYWDYKLDSNTKYTFGIRGNKAINFYSLIEFYTFFKLREKGVSAKQINKFHLELSNIHKTRYPFAIATKYYVENRKRSKKIFLYYKYLDSLIKFSPKKQFTFQFVEEFLEKVEFDNNNLAIRFYPLLNSKNVVVDPKHQFGQPTIIGTNIKTQTLGNLFKGGESIQNICNLYDLSFDKVQDALKFQNAAA